MKSFSLRSLLALSLAVGMAAIGTGWSHDHESLGHEHLPTVSAGHETLEERAHVEAVHQLSEPSCVDCVQASRQSIGEPSWVRAGSVELLGASRPADLARPELHQPFALPTSRAPPAA